MTTRDELRQWQPIGTAPRDGANIFLFCPNGICGYHRADGMTSDIVVGTYRGRTFDGTGYWICDVMELDHGYYPDDCSHTAIKVKPTHWMPLPEPPE